MSKILITGATGLLGSSISPYITKVGHQVVRHGKSVHADVNFDLTSENATQRMLDKVRPEIIINLVALTNVDYCDRNPREAYLVNTKTVGNIVNWIKNNPACHLIHISTDQVYDGEGPHKEDQLTLVNTYAYSKYAAELLALQVGATVLRTNYFGFSNCDGKMSFSDWLLKALYQKEKIKVFTDIRFSPLLIGTICHMVSVVIKTPLSGIFNMGSKGVISKADFAFELARNLELDNSNMQRALSSDAQLKAKRPNDMCMDSSYFEDRFGVLLPGLLSEIHKLMGISNAKDNNT